MIRRHNSLTVGISPWLPIRSNNGDVSALRSLWNHHGWITNKFDSKSITVSCGLYLEASKLFKLFCTSAIILEVRIPLIPKWFVVFVVITGNGQSCNLPVKRIRTKKRSQIYRVGSHSGLIVSLECILLLHSYIDSGIPELLGNRSLYRS